MVTRAVLRLKEDGNEWVWLEALGVAVTSRRSSQWLPLIVPGCQLLETPRSTP